MIFGTLILAVGTGYFYLQSNRNGSVSPFQNRLQNQIGQTNNQPTKQVLNTTPTLLFMQTNLPDYSKHKYGSISLSTIKADTNEKDQLMNFDACYLVPTLSPDKTKMAYLFMSNSECEKEYFTNKGNTELWVYVFQTKGKQQIANDVWKFVVPQWSSDSRLLGYERVTDLPHSVILSQLQFA